MKFETPQVDIDRCLAVEASVTPDELPLYMECMGNVPLSTRVLSPRPCDCEGRDVRDGCLLTGVFMQCRKSNEKGERNECTPPAPCWAVFLTKAWGQKIEERQWSVALPKEEAKEYVTLLRRMEKEFSMGKRYRMRKLTNVKAQVSSKAE